MNLTIDTNDNNYTNDDDNIFVNPLSNNKLFDNPIYTDENYINEHCITRTSDNNRFTLNSFKQKKFEDLKKIYLDFSIDDAIEIKKIEKVTNHDVKAVEYFLRQRFDELGISEFKEFIHFGLTSQDINNTAIPLSLKEFINDVYLVKINELLSLIEIRADDYENIKVTRLARGLPVGGNIEYIDEATLIRAMEERTSI